MTKLSSLLRLVTVGWGWPLQLVCSSHINCKYRALLSSVIISFPPFTGHTTLCTLAGFTYGMKGFFIGASASVIGSAIVFVLLRLLFKNRLHAWSNQNERWKALEAVVVCDHYLHKHFSFIIPSRRQKVCH